MTGAFIGDKGLDENYARHIEQSGTAPELLLTFVPWSEKGETLFPAEFCQFARGHGAVPIITWEPWEPWSGWFPLLKDIADGKYDLRIRAWALAAKQFDQRIMLRFAHEMNGNWYPWSESKDVRQSPEAYVAAWRRVYQVFAEVGAKNVEFMWCPNFEPAEGVERWYPGDDFVHWIGIDVYNGPEHPRSPVKMLHKVYSFAVKRNKPVILAEVGCAEQFEDRARITSERDWAIKDAWINELFRVVADQQAIRGLVWFDVKKESDWRIGSSASGAAAYRRGVSNLSAGENSGR